MKHLCCSFFILDETNSDLRCQQIYGEIKQTKRDFPLLICPFKSLFIRIKLFLRFGFKKQIQMFSVKMFYHSWSVSVGSRRCHKATKHLFSFLLMFHCHLNLWGQKDPREEEREGGRVLMKDCLFRWLIIEQGGTPLPYQYHCSSTLCVYIYIYMYIYIYTCVCVCVFMLLRWKLSR